MNITQEPKYDLVQRGDKIRWQNRSSGRTIPDYEPVFVLRGGDAMAATVLLKYASILSDTHRGAPLLQAHQNAVLNRMHDFNAFWISHPHLMKIHPVPAYETRLDETGHTALFNDDAKVPEYEPLFLFRARDKHACEAIAFYIKVAPMQAQIDCAQRALEEFQEFRRIHGVLMKTPDTDNNPNI